MKLLQEAKVLKRKQRGKKRDYTIKNVLFFIVLVVSVLFVFNMRTSHMRADSTVNMKILSFSDVFQEYPRTLPDLSVAIRERIQKEPGIYSVRYEDLTTNEAFGINDDIIVTAASVNKIPILVALYYQVEQGAIDLDEEITIDQADVQNWGTGSIRYDTPGTTYTIREIAEILMKKSDNTAAYVLSHNVMVQDKIQDLVSQWGLINTNMEENKTSNKDMAKLMRMIYNGDIINKINTQELLSFMEDSDFEERIPKLLPQEVRVYHKIGNEVRVTHDVGIVDIEGKPYYIGVLGTEIPNHEKAMQVIAEISKLVYEYQMQK